MPTPSQHAFAEKVALISDGTNPIGRAVALQLALYGCYVIVGVPAATENDRNALNELKSLGTLADYVEADSAKVSGAKKLIETVEKIYGRLDLLVNCLKFEGDWEFEETSEVIFDTILQSSLKGTFFLTQEALRLIKPRPKGRIVNIISACDSFETERNPAFVAANSAVVGLTKNLAKNLPESFRVNAVAVSEKEKKGSHFDKFDVPDPALFRAKKGVATDDIARAVIFLLSSEAVGINGQVLKVE